MITTDQFDAMKDRWEQCLIQEGYRPERTEDGDIRFKSEGHRFYVEFDREDPSYIRLLVPQSWPIDDAAELKRAYVVASEFSQLFKCVKVSVHEEQAVWFSVESMFACVECVEPAFVIRSVEMIHSCLREFSDRMKATGPTITMEGQERVVLN